MCPEFCSALLSTLYALLSYQLSPCLLHLEHESVLEGINHMQRVRFTPTPLSGFVKLRGFAVLPKATFLCFWFDKVGGFLRPVQQPGSYWDRSSELPLVGLEPTEVTAYD